jgi:hypothetical protein
MPVTAAQPSRPTPISYPIGAQHLPISHRATSRATDVLIRCLLAALFWYAQALLRRERRTPKARFLPIWSD